MDNKPQKRVAALIVAAGRGVRAGGGVPKQYRSLGRFPVLRHAINSFSQCPEIGLVLVVINPLDRLLYDAAARGLDLPGPVPGGATRQESVRAGLEMLARSGDVTHVLIHDAARPFVTSAVIRSVVEALDVRGVTPVLPVADSLRRAGSFDDVPRDDLWRVQTPQGFPLIPLLEAHRGASEGHTDDVSVFRAAGGDVTTVPGDEENRKLTTADDFNWAEAKVRSALLPRTGSGYDVHRLGPGDHVWLCGVRVPNDRSLIGHSDADVALHALTDALLGAIGAGDIGSHFPPSDERWRGAPSDRFLAHAAKLVAEHGGTITNVDVTIICEAPRIGPHREAMRARIGNILDLPVSRVSVKATTTEKLGFTGRSEGIAAQAVATVLTPDYVAPHVS